jgi:cobalamin biosynthesis protein CobT
VDSSLEKDIVNMVTSPKDMGYKDIIEKVKDKERDDLSEKLTDVILEAKEGAAVPSSLAKKILYSWQGDQLASEKGLKYLLKAAMKADEERSKAILDEMGLGGD